MTMNDQARLSQLLKSAGADLGFAAIRIAPAISPPGYHPLLEWIAKGYAADMTWISRRLEAYEHPNGVLPGTRSVVMAALNYHNEDPPPGLPRISRYAWGKEDYHSVLRRQLKILAQMLQERSPENRTRVVVDTAPILERDFARQAGIGWFGKNTMLISREIGSWFFLGAILTTAELDCDEPFDAEYCGTCTSCLDACPTDAFPEPSILDASRCISYLTIERRDKSIPESLREGIQDWVFGCDVCQEVCPWNRFAPTDSVAEFRPRKDLKTLTLERLLTLTEEGFATTFAGTPLERTGRSAIVRNAAIVAGNHGLPDLLPILKTLKQDESGLVSEAATWAVTRIQERQPE